MKRTPPVLPILLFPNAPISDMFSLPYRNGRFGKTSGDLQYVGKGRTHLIQAAKDMFWLR